MNSDDLAMPERADVGSGSSKRRSAVTVMVGNLSCLGNEPLPRRVLTHGLSKDLASLTQARCEAPPRCWRAPVGLRGYWGTPNKNLGVHGRGHPLTAIRVCASGMLLQTQLRARETCQQPPLRVMARLVA
jgi:hypothetical protein